MKVPHSISCALLFGTTFIQPQYILGLNTLFETTKRLQTPGFVTKISIRHPSSFSHSRSSSTFFVAATTWNYDSRNLSFLSKKRTSSTSIHQTTSTIESLNDIKDEKKTVPVTLLSGFLGSGKTSTLKNILENRSGIKVGVVVNDVANVNIDAKLISNPNEVSTDENGTVELQNGCACCSLADELLTSVQSLLDGRDFDAVVVELSGVADPVAVRRNWEQAKLMDHPVTKRADIKKVVTLVDACTFGTDWMTWNVVGDRKGWVPDTEDCSDRKVPELLAEQVEAADVLIINKVDLAEESQVKTASALAEKLNEKASLFEVSYGNVSQNALLGIEDATKIEKEIDDAHSHDHSHEKSSNNHSHDHSHSHDHDTQACTDSDCNDPTHDHSHSHDHDGEACTDPECNDPTHDHSHSHDHGSLAENHLGIVNFVYKSDRPFNARKLLGLLNTWPIPIKDELDLGQLSEAAQEGIMRDDGVDNNPFVGVLRSKGFAWMAPTCWEGSESDAWRHDTAMYWSHAGKHFGINIAGKWWGSISKEDMKNYFSKNMKEYERILSEDWASEEFADRRQEIVFIGIGINEKEIIDRLDDCILTDEEMVEYRQNLQNTFGISAPSESLVD